MNILIIEDEALAARQIELYLGEIDENIKISAIIESVEDGVAWMRSNPTPDLIISDIKLTDGLSFDIFFSVKPLCPIIFTTAYDQYAIKAFELNSIGYILKPLDKNKLRDCIEKVSVTNPYPANIDIRKLAEMISSEKKEYKTRFLVKNGQKIRAISVDKIAYFYSHEKLNFLITRSNEKYPIDQTLEEIDMLLDPQYFFRLNRKFITHFEGLKDIHPYFKGRLKITLVPEIGEEIVISSERTPLFKAWLDK